MTAQPITTIPATDKRLTWSGAVSLQHGDGWVMPWRLPFPDLKLYPPDALRERAAAPAGVRLRFATDAEQLRFNTEPLPTGCNLDLYADDKLVETVTCTQAQETIDFGSLPSANKTIELWLHQTTPLRLRSVELPSDAQLQEAPDNRPKWVTYGSSITHCGAASTPSNTWPAVTARLANVNLTSLGYGGNCHMEPMVTKMISSLPADIVSAKVGINVYGGNSLSPRSFLPTVIGVIDRIRDGHPNIPIVVCSPIFSPQRETQPNAVGLTLVDMRKYVEEAVTIFRERGDENLFYVDGLKLFGPDLAHLLPDDLHPNAEGYVRLGENFHREVFETLLSPRKH